jgi:hypothetical protein
MPANAPAVTALRCRVVSVNEFGGITAGTISRSTCPRVLRGENSHATMLAVYAHLRDDHRADEEEADSYASDWVEAAQRRVGARAVLTDVLTENGIEVTEEQAKAIVASLTRRNAPVRVDFDTVYGPR